MRDANEPEDFTRKYQECDDKFKTVFNLTSVASKVIDSNLIILKANDALVDLLGFAREEIEGSKILDYACDDYKAHWHELQEALWTRNIPFFKLEACLIKKDKSLVWVSITTILFKDDDVTYGFTVLDNITGLKYFEESQKRLNIALQHSKMAIWDMNLKSGFVFRSDSHDEIFGYPQQLPAWTRETYLRHILADDAPGFENALYELKHSSTVDIQCRIQTADGVVKWVHFEGIREYDPIDKSFKVLGTINDITKEKLVERHKDDFIGIASHELRTPITGLKASIQLLSRMKENLNERARSLINMANKSMSKINILLDDLLNVNRLNEDLLNLNKTSFNMAGLIKECVSQINTNGNYKTIIKGDMELEVNADAERIERVLINFVNNAIKYAPDSITIHIYIERIANTAKVSVTDKGPGIPPEKQPYLFNRYYRAVGSESLYSGLGLGLYINAEIIKKHQGQIGVTSKVGQGSTFWFSIPIA